MAVVYQFRGATLRLAPRSLECRWATSSCRHDIAQIWLDERMATSSIIAQ